MHDGFSHGTEEPAAVESLLGFFSSIFNKEVLLVTASYSCSYSLVGKKVRMRIFHHIFGEISLEPSLTFLPSTDDVILGTGSQGIL